MEVAVGFPLYTFANPGPVTSSQIYPPAYRGYDQDMSSRTQKRSPVQSLALRFKGNGSSQQVGMEIVDSGGTGYRVLL